MPNLISILIILLMDNNQIIIPEGWTYYAHRTNTCRWDGDPSKMGIIVIDKIMSVVTERDIYQELRDYGEDYLLSYSSGQGEAFEIRCLICDLSYLRTMDDENEIKNIMLKEYYYDRRNFGGCYGQRHHSIQGADSAYRPAPYWWQARWL